MTPQELASDYNIVVALIALVVMTIHKFWRPLSAVVFWLTLCSAIFGIVGSLLIYQSFQNRILEGRWDIGIVLGLQGLTLLIAIICAAADRTEK